MHACLHQADSAKISSLHGGNNADLWQAALECETVPIKVKAHQSGHDFVNNPNIFVEYLANGVADAFAGAVTHCGSLDDLALEQAEAQEELPVFTCMRAAICEHDAWQVKFNGKHNFTIQLPGQSFAAEEIHHVSLVVSQLMEC